MRRTLRPAIDQLEGKALLSGFSAPFTGSAPSAVPAGVQSSVIVSAPTISQNGSVTLSLVETNTTSSPVSFTLPANKEGFQIYQHGIEVWTSNPHALNQNIQLITLAPGQSTTLFQATWSDSGNVHPISGPGTFTAVSEFDQTAPTATVTVQGIVGATGSTPVEPTTGRVYSRIAPRGPVSFH